MIIDVSQGDIEVVGDIKEFKTSIDPKNLEFITTLLSSNLYSDPEQSFIREIVSNAWDSHVEAGTTDIPVIIKFGEEGNNHHVTIRDYGTGLSPERFKEVYCNIGSSTKRESNDYIGGFGIGKYSSLSCSNTVYITSYYEGIAYYYVMIKSGNSITTNLLVEKPTTEKNGVEVTIKNIFNIRPYERALNHIVFFPNIYVNGIRGGTAINDAKLKRFENFAAASIILEDRLLLGNVLYPCNDRLLSQESSDFLTALCRTGIVIKFDVGEINITPNRESIIYNPSTIKKINDRIAAAKAELDALVEAKLAKDYDDIVEYYKIMYGIVHYEPISDSIVPYLWYRVDPRNMPYSKITYNGIDLRESMPIINKALSAVPPTYKGVVWGGRVYTNRLPCSVWGKKKLNTPNILILNAGARFSEATRLYLRDNYDGYCVITDITYQEFKEWVKCNAEHILIDDTILEIISRGIYDSLYKRAKRLDLNTDPSYLDFKKELSTDKVSLSVQKKVILYEYDIYGRRFKRHFEEFSQAVDYIKSLRKGIILADLSDSTSFLYEGTAIRGIILIQASKNVIINLRKLNLRCILDKDWLIKKDPISAKIKAVLSHFPEKINGYMSERIFESILNEEGDELRKIVRLRNIYGENPYYKTLTDNPTVKCDAYTEYLCLKLKDYITKYTEAKAIVTSAGLEGNILITAVIMKTKAYKISPKAYEEIRNNKLLRIICRK